MICNELKDRKRRRGLFKWPENRIVRTEFQINQFISLKLMELEQGTRFPLVYANGRGFDVYVFSFEEAYEILRDTSMYYCMDEACRSPVVDIKSNFSNVDSNTMFWNFCYYIKAWIDHDYDTRLLCMEDAFPILKALYKAGDSKAREVFKLEITKRLLSGYFPVITYLISKGYLVYFEYEEIIWLLEECIEIVGSHNYSSLKKHIFWFLSNTGEENLYNENFEKAIKYLNDALRFSPSDIRTLNQLGEAYLGRGEYELARALFEKAINLPSSDYNLSKLYKREAMCNLGKSYNRLYLFNKAITACNKVMDLYLDHVNVWDQIAIAHEGMGDFKRAKEAQKKFKKKANKMKINLGRRRIRLFVKIREINEKKMKKIEKRILKRRRINEIKIRFDNKDFVNKFVAKFNLKLPEDGEIEKINNNQRKRIASHPQEINNFSLAISNVKFQDFSKMNKSSRSLYDEVIETYKFSDNQVLALLSEEYQTILDIIKNHRIINKEIVVAIRAKLIELVNLKIIEEALINGSKAWRLRNY